ncbi:helix-turn-helix transcriptional regulator [Brevibacterium antiquum]|uniref:Predicted transcriptional regulator, ArsR family n=1 Tax=Brevibacterium antiquum CNRZ 918 TaxID=1255637 RepID=A0A2H1KWH6_9MICO|nr:helix-turn-helix domain-containing protein [Brevibacterium antiquum]SMY04116.1 Predicted transcriptional regulator, ArsR family [Brevibacterium antiquum CNRZ 918]
MKINRASARAESSALGPGPAIQTTGLSPAIAAVLEHLSAQAEPVSIGALSAMTGLHGNTVREHLEELIAAGYAAKERALSQGRGRPAWLYFATDTAAAAGAVEYAGLASALAAHIHRTSDSPRLDGIAAGVDWGRQLAADFDGGEPSSQEPSNHERTTSTARSQTISLLEDLGFAPAVVADFATNSEPEASAGAGANTVTGDADAAVGGAGDAEDSIRVRLTRCPLLSAAHQYPDIVCGVHLGLVRGALDVFGDRDSDSELEPFAEPGACRLHLQPRKESQ